MKSIIKYVSIVIIFTALTKTYVLWASILSISVGTVTGVFLVMSTMMILLQMKNFVFIYPKKLFMPIVYFFILAPVLVTIITRIADIRALILQVFFVIIFILTYLFYKNYGSKIMFRLFFFTLIFTILFGFLSIFNPAFFADYADIVQSYSSYGGRAFGFHMQPNAIAYAMNLLFIGIIVLSPKVKYIIYLYPLVFTGILSTGSKSNFAGFTIISLFLLAYLWKHHKVKTIKVFKTLLIASLISVIVAFLSLQILSIDFQSDKYSNLIARVDTILLQDTDSLAQDFESGSMAERLDNQEYYKKLILQNIWTGHGFGIQHDLMDKDILIGSAHNIIYEILLEGGVFYMLFFIYFIIKLVRNYFTIDKNMYRLLIAYKSFLTFMLFYIFFTTTFFDERSLYVLLAVFAVVDIQKDTSYENK